MDSLKFLQRAKRIVIKVGSATLVDPASGILRREWLKGLAEDVADLKRNGADVLIASSGSIALGRNVLGINASCLSLEQSQAAAAVGQIRLAKEYEEALEPHGLIAGQVLLTLEDSENRRRYLNSRSTFAMLLAQDVVPIINENDTVATDEIRFGDNDRLAAQVAAMVGADVLIILSDVDGLYDRDPRSGQPASLIPEVKKITKKVEDMAGDTGSGLSKGGMKTKLLAAKTATVSGCAMAITLGSVLRPVEALKNGANCTWFLPVGDPLTARKNWVASMKPRGRVAVDEGAAGALMNGKSLLPVGVRSASGEFGRGDPVEIIGPNEETIGVGLARYTQAETAKICGRKSAEIESILGYPARTALVHRDDMTMLIGTA